MIEWMLQAEADLPSGAPADWLSRTEWKHYAGLKVDKRRRDWLLGRWTAKHLVGAYARKHLGADLAPSDLSIEPAEDGAPQLVLAPGTPPAIRQALRDLSLSISHARGRALCALGDVTIGADIEYIEPRAIGFAVDYFTPGELVQLRSRTANRDLLVTAIWSAKEAALKATRRGLTVDTRSMECTFHYGDDGMAGWRPFTATYRSNLVALPWELADWWRIDSGFVLTIAVGSPWESLRAHVQEETLA